MITETEQNTTKSLFLSEAEFEALLAVSIWQTHTGSTKRSPDRPKRKAGPTAIFSVVYWRRK